MNSFIHNINYIYYIYVYESCQQVNQWNKRSACHVTNFKQYFLYISIQVLSIALYFLKKPNKIPSNPVILLRV